MKLIIAILALIVPPAYATEKTDQPPLMCDFFGLLCPNEDEEDGDDWGGPLPDCFPRCGGGGGPVDVFGGQGPVDPKRTLTRRTVVDRES